MTYPHDIVIAVTREKIEDVCRCVACLSNEAVIRFYAESF